MSRLLISGVNRGIGENLAKKYLENGHEVFAVGRTVPSWAERYAGRFSFHRCDLSLAAGMKEVCQAIDQPLDTVICSAADFGGDAFHLDRFDPAALAYSFAVNCIAPAMMVSLLKPNLLAGARQHIVFMSTGNASLGGNAEGSMLAYRMTKSALNQLMRNVAAEWSDAGFTAVALNPGWVRTRMGGENAPLSATDAADEIYNFCETVLSKDLNGCFCNTDGSELPW